MKNTMSKGYKAGYDPDQPRDEQGRWTDSGGGGSTFDGGGFVSVSASSGNVGISRIASAADKAGIPADKLKYYYDQVTGEDGREWLGAYSNEEDFIVVFPAALKLDDNSLYGVLSHEYSHMLYEKVGRADTILEIAESFGEGDPTDLLKKMGGITQYSQEFWRGYKYGNESLDTAINETLAEVAYKRGIGEPIENDIWEKIYDEMLGIAE